METQTKLLSRSLYPTAKPPTTLTCDLSRVIDLGLITFLFGWVRLKMAFEKNVLDPDTQAYTKGIQGIA